MFPVRVHPLKNGLVKNSSRVSAPRGATLPTVVSSAVTRRHAQRLAARQMWPRGHRTSLRMDVFMQINEDGDRCRTVSPPGADGSLGIPETPESLLPWVEGNLPWKMGNAIRRKYQGTWCCENGDVLIKLTIKIILIMWIIWIHVSSF